MKILIIEDDAIVAVMQRMWITKTCQCNAEIFVNGEEALKFLDADFQETSNEEYLIFLDINMPVMNGWEFLEVCENRIYASRLSVVIVTSSGFEEDILRARKSRLVVDYQNKPIDASRIPDYLQNIDKKSDLLVFPNFSLN